MSSRLRSVIFDAHDPARLAGFWAALLRRSAVDGPRGPLLPGSDTQVGLRFSPDGAAKPAPNPVHLHLTSTSPADQQEVVTAALRLAPGTGRNRQRFELVSDGDLAAEVERLIEAGAIGAGTIETGVVALTDPDGNGFDLVDGTT